MLFGLALSREFVYFERADDALFVVGVQYFGGGGVDLLKERKERLFPLPLKDRLVLFPDALICGRTAQGTLVEERIEIEGRAADYDGHFAAGDDVF